jgi:mycofactocin precursor peptide MftA
MFLVVGRADPSASLLPQEFAVSSVDCIRPLTSSPGVLMSETTQTEVAAPAPEPEEPLVEESLVEEVSIDGMCGVY